MDSDRNRRRSKTDPRSRERLVAAVVRNRRRRYALYYLHQRSGPVPVAEVARQVAAWERPATRDEVASERVAAVAATLRRRHLPILAEWGLVAYDADRDRVVGRVSDPTVELLLANDPRTRVAWYKVYLLVTAISAGFLALVRLGVAPFDGVDSIVAAALVVVLFAVASLGHWYDVYRWRRANEDMPPDFLVTLEEEVTYRDPRGEADDEAENEERNESETAENEGTDGEDETGDRAT
ncbi:DUF7344 domain-containing protein [Halorussus pelagicus]|uniref:DUF7344 domain-containing protein n=1 Tax=Halorussus pelagicus TaxID=2505977 RepID=UPI000FFB1B93|nr:hypothetical protein [Halorussus pelagicus]